MNLSDALKKSGLGCSLEAASAVSSGWQVFEYPEDARCEELESTYRVRLAHLKSFAGDHAQQLSRSVEEFLPGLRAHLRECGRWVSVRNGGEHGFLIFTLPASARVLGCMRVVGKQAVSSERWQELWHGSTT